MNTIADLLETKGYDVHSITPESSALSAVDEMCRKHVGALLVVDEGVLLGVVSERDLLTRILLKRCDQAQTRVREIMTTSVVWVDPSRTVGDAMRVMTEHRCRHLPVLFHGKLVGLVSIGDLVRSASEDQRHEIRMLHEYVEGRYPG